MVLLHGGCFLKQYEGFAQTSAWPPTWPGRGYAVWNVEYRKLGEAGAGYPGTFQDVATAVDALRGRGAEVRTGPQPRDRRRPLGRRPSGALGGQPRARCRRRARCTPPIR